MKIPGLISLLKLFISFQELILILELIPNLELILIPIPEHIAIPILNPESFPESTPESAPESISESAPEWIPTTESSRSDSELPSLQHTSRGLLVEFFELQFKGHHYN